MKKFEFLDPVTVALVIALVVGLGIAFHQVFFLVAFVLAMVALIPRVFHAVAKCIHRARLAHRHP
jgi:ABC-type transport system involved in cytochrome bd biosynthesis fused ATPase/permease subunit